MSQAILGKVSGSIPGGVIWALSPNRNFGVTKGSGGIGLSWDIRLWGDIRLSPDIRLCGDIRLSWDIQL